ncbi:MAG: diaminopimelate epimerase [Clostridia bacterium]|nr:diaminopimelate epimerase [Clostridia bacterium]
MKFTKMQGIGNDYIYIDCFKENIKNPEALAKVMSPRHFSVGADGVILICPSLVADAKMRMFNLDGSEGKMCGNGIRCVAKYVYDSGIAKKDTLTIETLSGIKEIKVFAENGVAKTLTVNMGKPILKPKEIPVIFDGEKMINSPSVINGKEYNITAVSMGNPHAVIFVDDTDRLDFQNEGHFFEENPLFPEGVNTEFVKVIDEKTLQMRVYERGSGETFACGTGACATVVAAVLNGFCKKDTEITVKLLGGDLYITYSSDGFVYMRGAAKTVYDGIYYFDD